MSIAPGIFRQYDIRGIVGKDLTEQMLPPSLDVTPVTEEERTLHFSQRDVT